MGTLYCKYWVVTFKWMPYIVGQDPRGEKETMTQESISRPDILCDIAAIACTDYINDIWHSGSAHFRCF